MLLRTFVLLSAACAVGLGCSSNKAGQSGGMGGVTGGGGSAGAGGGASADMGGGGFADMGSATDGGGSVDMGVPKDLTGVNWISTTSDSVNFGYVVEAKIYPEDPNTLVLTMRNGGITMMDISNPSTPVILTHVGDKGTEGQDRLGNLLLVNALYDGGIYLYDVSNPGQPTQLTYFDITPFYDLKSGFRVLHAKIYAPSQNERYAILTGSSSASLVAVNISNPASPAFISALPTGVTDMEGIYVNGHDAFVGGFSSNQYVVIDLSDLSQMKIVKTLQASYYSEMVSEMVPERPNLLYAALWGTTGGLAVFDVSDPSQIHELSSVAIPTLPRANRVKIQGNYAFVPLEVSPGGLGVVDISNSTNLQYKLSLMGIPQIDKPYTLAVKGDYLYIWGAMSLNMAIMKLIKQ